MESWCITSMRFSKIGIEETTTSNTSKLWWQYLLIYPPVSLVEINGVLSLGHLELNFTSCNYTSPSFIMALVCGFYILLANVSPHFIRSSHVLMAFFFLFQFLSLLLSSFFSLNVISGALIQCFFSNAHLNHFTNSAKKSTGVKLRWYNASYTECSPSNVLLQQV